MVILAANLSLLPAAVLSPVFLNNNIAYVFLNDNSVTEMEVFTKKEKMPIWMTANYLLLSPVCLQGTTGLICCL